MTEGPRKTGVGTGRESYAADGRRCGNCGGQVPDHPDPRERGKCPRCHGRSAARNRDLDAIRLAAKEALTNYASVLDWNTEPAWEASRADLNRLLAEAIKEARRAAS